MWNFCSLGGATGFTIERLISVQQSLIRGRPFRDGIRGNRLAEAEMGLDQLVARFSTTSILPAPTMWTGQEPLRRKKSPILDQRDGRSAEKARDRYTRRSSRGHLRPAMA